jgi:transposase
MVLSAVRNTAEELDRRGAQHTATRSGIAQTQPQGARQAELVICDKAIERTFAWTARCRRLARDHEATPSSAVAFFVLAAATVLLRRLAKAL